MSKVFLGIDTSNYKTSVAAIDEDGRLLFERSELLEVPEGKRGLRQSEAFFHHSNRLPVFFREMYDAFDPGQIAAAGVSDRPRRVDGSYMPCFLAGINAAEMTSSSLRIPLYRYSHQDGHAAAVLPDSLAEDVIFMHLSGGTTEFLLCSPDETAYSMKLIGGTKDISIGQLIDRFGVARGLPFPSGSYLDETAYNALQRNGFEPAFSGQQRVLPDIKIRDGYFNLSGAETRLLRYEGDTENAAAELFYGISCLLYDSARSLSGRYGIGKVWMAGGVASSRTVRMLISKMNINGSPEIFFGDETHSGDNALGIAKLARRSYLKEIR